jgi:hypothetical protein
VRKVIRIHHDLRELCVGGGFQRARRFGHAHAAHHAYRLR